MSKPVFFGVLALVAIAYAVGNIHGKDVARLEVSRAAAETVVAEYPYAGVCSEMLESAWSAKADVIPPLPHKP